jgi:hypothetical protein
LLVQCCNRGMAISLIFSTNGASSSFLLHLYHVVSVLQTRHGPCRASPTSQYMGHHKPPDMLGEQTSRIDMFHIPRIAKCLNPNCNIPPFMHAAPDMCIPWYKTNGINPYSSPVQSSPASALTLLDIIRYLCVAAANYTASFCCHPRAKRKLKPKPKPRSKHQLRLRKFISRSNLIYAHQAIFFSIVRLLPF